MSSASFRNVIYKMCLEIINLIYMYKKNLTLNQGNIRVHLFGRDLDSVKRDGKVTFVSIFWGEVWIQLKETGRWHLYPSFLEDLDSFERDRGIIKHEGDIRLHLFGRGLDSVERDRGKIKHENMPIVFRMLGPKQTEKIFRTWSPRKNQNHPDDNNVSLYNVLCIFSNSKIFHIWLTSSLSVI